MPGDPDDTVAAAAAAAPDADIKALVDAMAKSLVETRRDIHRHPELGNREERTGKLVAERLRAAGLEVRYPVAKTRSANRVAAGCGRSKSA